jgi:predicted RND superfamily exporter protein
MQLCTVVLESVIQSLFIRLGFFIGRRPVAIIAAVSLLTLICSFGMLRFEEINNVRTEYSPTSSPSRYEYAVAKRFMQQNGSIDPSYVMIRANDGGSLMRPEHRQQAYNLTTSMLAEVIIRV